MNDFEEVEEELELVVCKFCYSEVLAEHVHLHQGEWVGECCWDERLRMTE